MTSTSRRLIAMEPRQPWPVGKNAPPEFDDERTAAFWPTFQVDGGTQSTILRAKVKVGTKDPVVCQGSYELVSESRRPRIERFRLLPGWIETPTDEDFGYAANNDLAVSFRVTNPGNVPIYARIIQEPKKSGETLVALPAVDGARRHPVDPDLFEVMGVSPGIVTTTGAVTQFILPLYSGTEGGNVRLELAVPDPQTDTTTAQPLNYATQTIRIVPPGTEILAKDRTLVATEILPLRNGEWGATPPNGSATAEDAPEPAFMIPAVLNFRVKGRGNLLVTCGGSVLAQATIDADENGNVISTVPPSGPLVPRVETNRSLTVWAPPADATATDVTVTFKDKKVVLPFVTVIKDVGALPIGHTFVKDVSVVDGHLQKSFSDLSVPGRNGGLSFSRSYTNRSSEKTPIGAGWSHSLRSFITRELSPGRDRYLLVGGEGTGQVFDCTNPTRGCRSQRGFHGKLEITGQGIVYTARSGTKFKYTRKRTDETYKERTWLTSVADPRGNETYYEYGGSEVDGEVVRVFEPGNRRLLQLEYAWPGAAPHPRLASVSLLSNPTGRREVTDPGQLQPIDDHGVCVAFAYDGLQNLTAATRYDGACTDGATPLRTESYEYAGGTNELLQNNLRFYTDPNGRKTEYVYHHTPLPPGPPAPGDSDYMLLADRDERVRVVREPAPGGDTTFTYELVRRPLAPRSPYIDTRPLFWTTVTPARPGSAPTIYKLDGYGATAEVERSAGGQRSVRTTVWDPIHIRPRLEQDPRGRLVSMAYDAAGNLVERRTSTTPLAAEGTLASATEPLVDKGGNVVEEIVERWAYDPDYGGETCKLDAEGRLTTTRYVLGLPVEHREYANPIESRRCRIVRGGRGQRVAIRPGPRHAVHLLRPARVGQPWVHGERRPGRPRRDHRWAPARTGASRR